MVYRQLCAAIVLVAVAGCGIQRKVELEGFALWDKPVAEVEHANIALAWVRKMGRGGAERYAKLRPELSGQQLFLADRDGWVTSYDTASGKTRWVHHYDVSFSSGPHVVNEMVLLGTRAAEVVVLARDDGHLLWRSRVSSEVLSVPQANRDWVVVQTVDGRVYCLRSRDGQRVWTYDRSVPVLSLRGTSGPVVLEDKVIVGFDNGKLVALALADGKLLWEQAVASPQGRTELERMVDIDGDLASDSQYVYAVSYQGKIAALTLDNGRVAWSRDMSAFIGPVLVESRLYIVDDKGVLWALDRDSGAAVWRQDILKGQASTAPVWQDGTVAVGTRAGAIYWFNAADGAALGQFGYRDLVSKIEDDANVTTSVDPFTPEDLTHVFEEYDVVASPVAQGRRLYVSYRNGVVAAVGWPIDKKVARP
ncbi:MAG: outer membrane protein assembly factor BamB [Pseudomonadota bacterium]